jgi:hypothetical protein
MTARYTKKREDFSVSVIYRVYRHFVGIVKTESNLSAKPGNGFHAEVKDHADWLFINSGD